MNEFEILVKNLLKSMNYKVSLGTNSNHTILVANNGKKDLRLFVRTDNIFHITNNILVKESVWSDKIEKDWLYLNNIDNLFYVDTKNLYIYIIDWVDLQRDIMNDNFQLISSKDFNNNCYNHVYAIPIQGQKWVKGKIKL